MACLTSFFIPGFIVFSSLTILSIAWCVMLFFLVPLAGIFSVASSINQALSKASSREFEPAPKEQLEVHKLVCPTRHQTATVSLVGLKARKQHNPLEPVRVASCTMPRNPVLCCDQRCLNQVLNCGNQ